MDISFARLGKPINEHLFSFLHYDALSKAAESSRQLRSIVASPQLFKVKAKQEGIVLPDDHLPRTMNLSTFQTMHNTVKRSELIKDARYQNEKIAALLRHLPPPAAPHKVDLTSRQAVFVEIATLLKNKPVANNPCTKAEDKGYKS